MRPLSKKATASPPKDRRSERHFVAACVSSLESFRNRREHQLVVPRVLFRGLRAEAVHRPGGACEGCITFGSPPALNDRADQRFVP